MERRAWWTDALIESVVHAISDNYDYEYRAYAVIAAVEDWHRDRWTGVCESPEEVVRELKQAQAAIQRVREQLHKPWKYECECCTRIWIALEGDSDE